MPARDTDWRQGDLLAREAAVQLGLIDAAQEGHWAVVITHDCDLRHDAEPCVEVIIAVEQPRLDPQLSYAKNPRRLHLTYEGAGAAPLILELRHGDHQHVPKADFAKRAVKDNSLALPLEAKRTLKHWLAARYGRTAFPDAFEARLRKRAGNRTVEQQIGKILDTADSKYLVGLFFDLDEQRGIEAAEGEPYALKVSVVYDSVQGGRQARESAEHFAAQLRELFERAYGKPEVATEIALDACEAVADTHLTLADIRRVDQWRLEYVSLRGDEPGDFLPVGETPA